MKKNEKQKSKMSPWVAVGLLPVDGANLSQIRTSLEDIGEAVSRVTGLTMEEIRIKRRTRERVMSRFLIMYFADKYCFPRPSLNQLAKFTGVGHHATVLHGIRTMQNDFETNCNVHVIIRQVQRYFLEKAREQDERARITKNDQFNHEVHPIFAS